MFFVKQIDYGLWEENKRLTFSCNGIEWGSLRTSYSSVLLGFCMLRIEGLQKDGEGASYD